MLVAAPSKEKRPELPLLHTVDSYIVSADSRGDPIQIRWPSIAYLLPVTGNTETAPLTCEFVYATPGAT